jgi:hypothetical protein
VLSGLTDNWLGRRLTNLGEIFSYITSLFGADFTMLMPRSLFMTFYLITAMLFWFGLLVLLVWYVGSQQKPLSGEAGTWKVLTFLLAFVSIALPFANLLPVLLLYFWVMAKHPR